MRFFVLILALVLLPLRGWLGGAMGVEAVAASPRVATVHAASADPATHAVDGAHAMHAVHHAGTTGTAALPAPHHPDDGASGLQDGPAPASTLATHVPGTHHGTDTSDTPAHYHGHCGLCQICHSAAMAEASQAAPVAPLARVRPQGPALQFASALLAQADKPPIS